MLLPKIVSLISVVALLGWMIYFFLGALPLLIVKHDDASDSRLVRGFFDVHYLALMAIATIGALSSAFADRRLMAAALGCIALVGFFARRLIVPRMDQLRSTLSAADAPAVRRFRRLHVGGLVLNVFLLIGFIAVLVASSAQIVSCSELPPGCREGECRVQCSLL